MGELAGLRVFLGHVLEAHLLGLEEWVLFVEGGVVEKFASRDAQSLCYGFDHIGRGVLAPLFDVPKVALGNSGFIGQCLQRKIPIRA